MGFSFRLTLVAGFALAVSLSAVPVPAAAAAPPWPQDGSDLQVDPTVLYGSLPNGMRYALMQNSNPVKQASIRLRIASGSINETDAQQGLAHFLEHMAFKGSTHVPNGEMVKLLQRKGLAFGADTNAFTEWTQTVYALDLPANDDDMIDTGLMLMRETASELSLTADALEPERGVVLSEERLRDTPAYRAYIARLNLVLEGQLASRRPPIGQVEILKNAPIQLLKDFYHENYRPERATLIMAGDFDPRAMEAKIKARFSDWKPVGPSVAEPNLGQVAHRGLTARVVQVNGTSTQLQINWIHPYDKSPDSVAKRAQALIETIGVAILNQRLSKLQRSEQPPFVTASATTQNMFRSARVISLAASTKPEEWATAMAALDQEERRIIDAGIDQQELDRILIELQANLQQQVDGASTRQTPRLATSVLNALSGDEVFTTPRENQSLAANVTKTLTVAQVNAALRGLFTGDGPLIQLSIAQPIEGGDAALLAQYTKVHGGSLAAGVADAGTAWPYTDFARDHSTPGWMMGAFLEGGLEGISREDLGRALASKIFGLSFGVQDQDFFLSGGTRPLDLDTQLQVFAAYVAHPGFRPQALERQRTYFLSTMAQTEATPGGILSRDLQGLMHSGDERWAFPTAEQLTAAKPEMLKAVLAGPLANGPIEITIVGDITPEQAIAKTAATFGALAPRPVPNAPPTASDVHFPRPVERIHKGRPDQAIALVAWPLPDFYADLDQSYAMDLVDDIFQFRLLEAVRIAEGATYSPQGSAIQSPTFKGYGYAVSFVETPPAKIAAFYAHVKTIAAAMAADGATADQLARAKIPRVEGMKKAQQTNGYWLSALAGVQTDPRKLSQSKMDIAGYEAVTRADIERAAKAYFRDDTAWKLTILPAPTPAN